MKIKPSGVLATAAFVLFAFGGTSHAAGLCSNATLKGPYGFTGHGQILGLLDNNNVLHPFAAASTLDDVAVVTFDGGGHFSRTDFGMINGVPKGGQTGFNPNQTGTYTVNADCTGTMQITYTAGGPVPAGVETDLQIVVSDDGTLVQSVVYKAVVPSSTPSADGLVMCPPNCQQGVQEAFEGKKVLIYGFR